MSIRGATVYAPVTDGRTVTKEFAERTVIDESEVFANRFPLNAMSVDVEEHFQVSAFENRIRRSEWNSIPSRVVANTERVIDLFAAADTKATFFMLGCVARKFPGLVRSIADAGHEVASHGYDHSRVSTHSPESFFEDVSRSRKVIEDIVGDCVIGYRAPSFSIGDGTPWAHDVLSEAGFKYSSSIYPISHDHYGAPSAPRFPFRFKSGGTLEIPLATTVVSRRNFPAAGGGYFRLLPLAYSRWSVRRINRKDDMPVAFYFHPWEVDPAQPRISDIPLSTRFRHYVNLDRFENRLKKMLGDFSWGRMDHVYENAISRG